MRRPGISATRGAISSTATTSTSTVAAIASTLRRIDMLRTALRLGAERRRTYPVAAADATEAAPRALSAKRPNETVLLYNPRCSKCRAAKALLEERRVEFEERLYLEDPLSHEELRDLRRKLARPPSEWIRAHEDEYEAAGLGPASSDDELLRAVAEHP